MEHIFFNKIIIQMNRKYRNLVLFFAFIVFFLHPAYSDEIKLLDVGNRYQATPVWSGIFKAPNDVVYQTPHLYHPHNTPIFIKGYYQTYLKNKHMLLRIPVTFDNGYESALFSADPSLTLGINLNFRVNPSILISSSILNFTRIGGSIKERPCRDSFLRQFHCGTGLAWVDSFNTHIKNDVPRKFLLEARLLF
jgi:hypothetical protein